MTDLLMFIPIILSLLCISLLCLPGCAVEKFPDSTSPQGQNFSNTADEFESQRLQMVEQQIRARGIQDRAVLEAMSKVPRHRFVDSSQAHLAYRDYPLPIGHDQTISQPYIVAYMTEAAEISPDEKVLEIGTGSGYQAAVLSAIAKEVYTIEIIPELAERARQTLSELGYKNVHVKTGDGYQGWAEHGTYDAILVTAAPDHIPEPLVNQLALNGRMVIPVGTWYQEMVVLTKMQDGVLKERTIPVRFVPLTRESPE
ncbi:MAG: protein-L-isoaspartate(D-aspartate) O-methyltransferase [Xenococcaceae cyanobacterium]